MVVVLPVPGRNVCVPNLIEATITGKRIGQVCTAAGCFEAFVIAVGRQPLSPHEEVPWSAPLLVVGTGASGRLPIMPEVWDEAEARGVELIALPTSEACEMLRSMDERPVTALLHVTC